MLVADIAVEHGWVENAETLGGGGMGRTQVYPVHAGTAQRLDIKTSVKNLKCLKRRGLRTTVYKCFYSVRFQPFDGVLPSALYSYPLLPTTFPSMSGAKSRLRPPGPTDLERGGNGSQEAISGTLAVGPCLRKFTNVK